MNRTVKEATIRVLHHPDLDSLKAHVLAFVSAYNFAEHSTALRWGTPFEAVCHAWATAPDIFKLNPRHLTPDQTTKKPGSEFARPSQLAWFSEHRSAADVSP